MPRRSPPPVPLVARVLLRDQFADLVRRRRGSYSPSARHSATSSRFASATVTGRFVDELRVWAVAPIVGLSLGSVEVLRDDATVEAAQQRAVVEEEPALPLLRRCRRTSRRPPRGRSSPRPRADTRRDSVATRPRTYRFDAGISLSPGAES